MLSETNATNPGREWLEKRRNAKEVDEQGYVNFYNVINELVETR